MDEGHGGVLVFDESPEIEVATNKFIDVPIILQYDTVPMIAVVRETEAGFRLEIPIYHRDGTYLAKVKGSQLYLTDAGRKAFSDYRQQMKQVLDELPE